MSPYNSQELMQKNQELQDQLDRPELFRGEHNIIRSRIAKNRRRLDEVLDRMVADTQKDKKVNQAKGLTPEEKKQKKKDYEIRKKQAK